MQVANYVMNQWGPALLVCFTLLTGLIYQNSRMSDMRDSLNKRMDDMNRRIDDLKVSIDHRFDDLRAYMASEFKRVDDRIDRLESPLARK